MNNVESAPKIKRETKNTIRVDFERTPFWERVKAKLLNLYTLKKVVWYLFRLLLLLGISYVILFPFFSKISSSFMSKEDFVDVTVILIPKHPNLDIYRAIIKDNKYFEALGNTFVLSLICAAIQTFVCMFIAYGFAKFKFKGNGLLFMCVIFTLVVPHATLQLSLFMKFRYFDVLGILNLLGGGVFDGLNITGGVTSVNFINTNWPLYILSLTGLGFKNGLYIFMLRQFFRGIPDELEESAYLDGSGIMRTFFSIIIPLSTTMMITVFMFAFCWQWTDNFYTELFYTTAGQKLLPDIIKIPKSLDTNYAGQSLYSSAITNTCGIMIIAPLIVLYLFGQRYIVQGIERSGLTAD
ncbi:MAG: carbohydrate ABC transporter permease [Clostridia bacterium]|nr:carbohydrate ABC transporter permease [Clostridia bacterium]